MAKVTVNEIKDNGFTYEGYGIAAADFDAYIDRVIESQSQLLKVKVGSAYESLDSGTSVFMARAELCMVCAEMLTRRLTVYFQSDGKIEGIDSFKIRRSIEQYTAEADALIDKLTNSGTSISKGFESGLVIS